MDRLEFNTRMKSIDEELAFKGISIHARAFHAFRLFSPEFNGPLLGPGIARNTYGDYEGPNLLEQISSWYKMIYADRCNVPTDLGKVPLILRNEIYIIRIPLVYGAPKIDIFPLVNGLTPAMVKSLSQNEINDIQLKFVEGYMLVYEFEDLSGQLETEAKIGKKRADNPFLNSALRDRDTAADCLEGGVDTNGAVFHSQQLAEKMLKSVIYNSASMNEDEIRKKYRHRIDAIFDDVVSCNKPPDQIELEIEQIAQYTMDIRYTSNRISKEDAVKSYWAALRIGGWCATLLSGHERRLQM